MTLAEAHDPTSSATLYPAHSAAPVSLSRNEIETLCMKASRGAGMSWGLAEEAAFAVGWPAAWGIDGAGALLAHLQNRTPCAIAVRNRQGTATSGAALCPIQLGATLDDHAALAAGPWSAPITISACGQPILLVRFLTRAVNACAKPLALTRPGGPVMILANGDADPDSLTAHWYVDVSTLILSPTFDAAPYTASERTMASISAVTLESLNILALRTKVLASDTSRRGAGAATSDND